MNASLATDVTASPEARLEFSLQSSIAESHRCARELDASVAHFRELLDKVATSPFVTQMRQLKTSVVG